ncbi:MAG: putative lyase [bacterium ADurb.Bin363]|nr:MAG: putative lyase [bacterium ADurb.Bin363]
MLQASNLESLEENWEVKFVADEIQKLLLERKIKGLIPKLGSNSPDKAIDQLVEIGADTSTYLISALRNKDYKIRKNAATCLGKIKDKKAIEPLMRVLMEDSNGEVEESVRKAFSNMGMMAIKPMIKLLEEDELEPEKKKKIADAIDDKELGVLTKSNLAIYQLAKGNFAECAKIGSPAVPYLIKALNKGDLALREKAETTLLRIGIGAISELVNTLSTIDENLRKIVMDILDKMDISLFHASDKTYYFISKGYIDKCVELGNSSVSALIRAMEDPRGEVVNNAIEALKRLGSIAVPDIIKELKGRKRKIKGKLAVILGDIGDKRGVDSLIACLSDLEPEVRINAAQSLYKIGDERAAPFLINKALLDKDKRVRVLTGDILKKMGKVVAPSLIRILEDPKSTEELKETSVKVLGEIKAEKAVDILTKIMLAGKGKLRELAARALGDIGSKKAIEALISVLSDAKELSGWQRGYNATIALGKIADVKAVPHLIKILKDENYLPQLQGAAAEALGKIRDKSVINELIKSLENKKIQREVIGAIGKLGNPEGIEPLLKIFYEEDSSTPLKALIIEACGDIGDYSATDAIIGALSKEQLRLPGIIALGKIREEKSIPQIEEILFDKNSDENLKNTCIEALISINKKASILSMLKILKSNTDENLKKLLIDSFPKMGEIIIKPFIDELKKDEKDVELHKNLIKVLNKLKSEKVVKDLLDIMLKTKEDSIKGEIIIAFGNIKSTACSNALMEILNDKNSSSANRKAALSSLINIGEKKYAPVLIKTLEDEDPELKSFSLKAFQHIGIPLVKEEED